MRPVPAFDLASFALSDPHSDSTVRQLSEYCCFDWQARYPRVESMDRYLEDSVEVGQAKDEHDARGSCVRSRLADL